MIKNIYYKAYKLKRENSIHIYEQTFTLLEPEGYLGSLVSESREDIEDELEENDSYSGKYVILEILEV